MPIKFEYKPIITNKVELAYFIETEAAKTDRLMIDVLLEYIDDTNISLDDLTKYLSPVLRDKLREEAIENNLMVRGDDVGQFELSDLFGDDQSV